MRTLWTLLLVLLLCHGSALLSSTLKQRHTSIISTTKTTLQADDSAVHNAPEEHDKSPHRRRGRIRPLRRQEQLSSRAQARKEQAQENLKRQEIAKNDPNLLVDMKFSQVVSPPTHRALQEIVGVDRMTAVQGETFGLIREGESLVARARTGTGKSLAFLVPMVERLLSMPPTQFQPDRQIGALIVAPTRELVMQIADTAKGLVTFHPTLTVRAIYGGTSIQRDVRSLGGRLPSILVATPGRLGDLIDDERVRGRTFVDILAETSIVVLDEADLLVLGGFGKDILRILSHLPRKGQTLLFSATIPKRLRTILPELCNASRWTQIDCVEDPSSTPRVNETYLALQSIDEYVPFLLTLIRQLLVSKSKGDDNCNKVMVFFPAVRMVRFFADILRDMKDTPVWEIHSQMSQSARRRVADSFQRTKNGVLLTSDVSARGMDYADVDTVIQYGLPYRQDLYLHRVGRTARAGRTGKAILVLMPFERLDSLGRMKGSIELDEISTSLAHEAYSEPREMRLVKTQVTEARQPLRRSAEGFVLAFLAYYAAHKPKGVNSSEIRSAGEKLAHSIGFLDGLPNPLSESLLNDLSN